MPLNLIIILTKITAHPRWQNRVPHEKAWNKLKQKINLMFTMGSSLSYRIDSRHLMKFSYIFAFFWTDSDFSCRHCCKIGTAFVRISYKIVQFWFKIPHDQADLPKKSTKLSQSKRIRICHRRTRTNSSKLLLLLNQVQFIVF